MPMKNATRAWFPLVLIVSLLVQTEFASGKQNSTAAGGRHFAMIIAGPGGEAVFTEKYLAQTRRLDDLLIERLGYNREQVICLFGAPAPDSLDVFGLATAAIVRRAFAALQQKMTFRDQLFIFMLGHGSFDGDWGKFNLVGPDLTDLDYAELLSGLPTKKIVFVNTASASGAFIANLSAEARVVITATKSGGQFYETNFADFFIDALATGESDFNKDNKVSVQEVFQHARTSQDKWFEEQRRVRAEHPLIDDNGDGTGSQHLEDAEDGLLASRIYLGVVSRELEAAMQRAQAINASEYDKLSLRKLKLEQEINELKAMKQQLPRSDYAKQLEKLLIELARTSKKLKALQSNSEAETGRDSL